MRSASALTVVFASPSIFKWASFQTHFENVDFHLLPRPHILCLSAQMSRTQKEKISMSICNLPSRPSDVRDAKQARVGLGFSEKRRKWEGAPGLRWRLYQRSQHLQADEGSKPACAWCPTVKLPYRATSAAGEFLHAVCTPTRCQWHTHPVSRGAVSCGAEASSSLSSPCDPNSSQGSYQMLVLLVLLPMARMSTGSLYSSKPKMNKNKKPHTKRNKIGSPLLAKFWFLDLFTMWQFLPLSILHRHLPSLVTSGLAYWQPFQNTAGQWLACLENSSSKQLLRWNSLGPSIRKDRQCALKHQDCHLS